MSLYDAVNIPTVESLALTNCYLCRQNIDLLNLAVDCSRAAVEATKIEGTSEERLKAQDCLAYTLTERSLSRVKLIEPSAVLTYESPEIREALNACKQTLQLAIQCDDRFIIHRAAYNLGRIEHEVGFGFGNDPVILNHGSAFGWFDRAYFYLMTSLSALEIYISKYGEPSEQYWQKRKTDILHRLVELCVLQNKGVIYFKKSVYGFFEIAQFLKDPSLARTVLKRPIFSEGEGRKMVEQIDEHSPVDANIQLPPIFKVDEMRAKLGDDQAILDFVIGNIFTITTLIHKSGIRQGFFLTNSLGAEWQRFLRPTAVELHLNYNTSPIWTVPSWDLRLLEGPGIIWHFSFPCLKLTPQNVDQWDVREENYETIIYPDVPWEKTLYNILFENLDDCLQQLGVKHLIIVPDGALNLVPFQILMNKKDFLSDKYKVSYATNMAVVAESIAMAKKLKPPESILIIKDPANSLIFSDAEVSQIGALFQPEKVMVLDDTNATKERIFEEATKVDAIHFCTHGRYDSENPLQSGLLIKDNSWFTIDDIKNLKLREGAIVFLSACETARLKLKSRFYSVGICPAFLQAGASTVVSTFWSVNDISAAKLSCIFYENLLKTPPLSRIDSLTEAIKYIRHEKMKQITKEGKDPSASVDDYYFWGAFSLYGAWK